MKFLIAILLAALPLASPAQTPAGTAAAAPLVPIPPTTAVLVLLTPRHGVTVHQIMAVMPSELRETVKLYLNGTIREWYSRGNGRGVILLLDLRSVEEARAVMAALPLAKEQLMDYEYIPVGPLIPLRMLLRAGS
ncbi:MAG TPA: hypothetical protein VGL42_05805 [Opitutaceae bacterium]|jgi:hypothetical protein